MTRRTRYVAAGTVLAGLAVVLVWFQPQTLLITRVVDEQLPGPSATFAEVQSPPSEATAPAPAVASAPRRTRPELLRRGDFLSRSRYSVRGAAVVLRLDDGRSVLRLEDFATTNGPDLRVYLAAAPAGASDDELADGLVDLGPLKGNKGNQNYAIPRDLDITAYRSAVVWCRRFAVGFGAADLAAPSGS